MKMKNTCPRIGTNILSLRRQTKLSQQEVAAALGVDRNTYAKWESGSRDIKAEYLPGIAEIFGVPVGDLFTSMPKENVRVTAHKNSSAVIVFVSEKKVFEEILSDIGCRLSIQVTLED